jgi:hypothetical protein
MMNLAQDRLPAYTTRTSPFLDQVRQVLRLKHMSRRTEASYLHYIIDYIRFHGKRHPREMGVASRNWWKFLERILTLFCTVVNG